MKDGTQKFSKSICALGTDAFDRLRRLKIAVFGVGGVGSWAAEALVRTGCANVTLIDFDTISESNINRQVHANAKTVGLMKADVMKERLREINPDASIDAFCERYPSSKIDLAAFDFIVDAIDSVADKADLIVAAAEKNVPLVSSMGAALRTDPTKICVKPFRKIEGDALARALRRKFKEKSFARLDFKCAVSSEIPLKRGERASLMTVTASFGMALAGEVIGFACRSQTE